MQDKTIGGRYYEELENSGKDEATLLEMEQKYQEYICDISESKAVGGKCASKFTTIMIFIWKYTFAKLGEDWVFLALMGIVMAVLSFFIDYGIMYSDKGRLRMHEDLTGYPLYQYAVWVVYSVSFVLFSATFVHIVSPQAVGSGIPEMKTIIRGVSMKEYLTFRTLVSKVIGAIGTLASGLPVGKEGIFVHLSCIVGSLLSKMVTSFKVIYENESRGTEMLAAGCAVAVASCFGSPIGGVLFSIEVTTAYFPKRNYWRAFFSAVCSAVCFRLLAVWFDEADTVKAFYQTNFKADYPFDPLELLAFALMGVVAGLAGALYVWFYSNYVQLIKKSSFLQKNKFLYAIIMSFIISTISFPSTTGKYIASDRNTYEQLTDLYSNFTFTKAEYSEQEAEIMKHWTTESTNAFFNLFVYFVYHFVFSAISYTIAIPTGSFIPIFKIGSSLGRIFGELMQILYPNGITRGRYTNSVIPGGYATVGAAAFGGAVTHSFSVSVIAFEVTGQITHVIPMMIAVLISNAVASRLQPSFYDSMILLKKLPYLPEIIPATSSMYKVFVEHFMVRDMKYIWKNITFKNLVKILEDNKGISVFPLVNNPESMILLGSVQRSELIKLIQYHLGRERCARILAERRKEAREIIEELEKRKKTAVRRRSSYKIIVESHDLETEQNVTEDSTNSETINSINGDCSTDLIAKTAPKKHVTDMPEEDQHEWEKESLEEVNFGRCRVDPAPFQLVERTSMLKVHSIFSLLGVDRAYVTSIGKLVGVVGLKELRKAIEDCNGGLLSNRPSLQHSDNRSQEAATKLLN